MEKQQQNLRSLSWGKARGRERNSSIHLTYYVLNTNLWTHARHIDRIPKSLRPDQFSISTAEQRIDQFKMATPRHDGGGDDRLSALPDATLTHILSYLPSDQAVRTSTLSSRWLHVFTAVPVVDLAAPPRRPCRVDDTVNSVLLGRDGAAPIRSFRVVGFRSIPSATLIYQWIAAALFGGAETIEFDLPTPDADICPTPWNGGDSRASDFLRRNLCTMPRNLFSSNGAATLRHLRLGNCKLDLPEHEHSLSLGSLETLSLRRINAPEHTLQRLISGCPRLAELTLDECPTVRRISVVLLQLRTFTIRCCHRASRRCGPSLTKAACRPAPPCCRYQTGEESRRCPWTSARRSTPRTRTRSGG